MRRHPRLFRAAAALLLLLAGVWLARGAILGWLAGRARDRLLPREAIEEDLAALETRLETRYAYLKRKGIDWRSGLEAIRGRAAGGLRRGEFGIELMRFLAAFGDGHTRVRKSYAYLPEGYVAFRLRPAAGGLAAVDSEDGRLLDEAHPFAAALDGLDPERWIEAASAFVAQGSPQLVRNLALDLLPYATHLRDALGLPHAPTLRLELVSAARDSRRVLDVDVTGNLFEVVRRGRAPQAEEPEVLEGGIGYLPIPSMDVERVDGIRDAMEEFRGTRGLVLDVRGNGGGLREPLFALFPYFQRPQDPPRVVNLAAFRLREGDDPSAAEGHLQDRGLFPAAWPGWTQAAREAIAAAAAAFRPEWTPPEGEFSAWHYCVLEPMAERSGRPYYHYDKPVVVLLDGDCYSATDIFLAALAGWRGVTLLGTPSGGGSGRALPFRLPRSGIELRLSSMASFRPDGTLLDGRGVEPDVLVEPEADDFAGRGDAQLEAALALLR